MEIGQALKRIGFVLLVLLILWMVVPILPFLLASVMAVVFLALVVRLVLPP